MTNSEFYNILSSNYDAMIKFENSLQNKIAGLKNFIDPSFKTALDLGCGTGVDSIALSLCGLNVDAIDHSEEMLKLASVNAEKYNAKINYSHSDLISFLPHKKYNFITSLGNTLANLTLAKLDILFSNLKNLITENGIILFQTINFSSLPKSGEFILKEFENEKIKIVRKYKMQNDQVNFIIEIFQKETNTESKIITELYPLSVNDFKSFAEKYSFDFEVFGSLKKETYNEKISNNIISVFKFRK